MVTLTRPTGAPVESVTRPRMTPACPASRLVGVSRAKAAHNVSNEMRFPTEPPREQRRDGEGPASTGYRVAESATSQGGPPGCGLRLDMRARAQKAAGRGAPGGGTSGAPSGDYGASGVQLDPRPRALHSSVGIGITLKTLSVVSSFGSPGHQ